MKKVDTLTTEDFKLVAGGKAAIVPREWLDKLLSVGGKEKAIRRRQKAHTEGGRERLYVASGDRDAIRGRERSKAVWTFVKEQGEKGATMSQISSALKMPLSTIAYTLKGLHKKHVVRY